MLNDIRDAQKLKAIVGRTFEGEDGKFLMDYLEIICNYNIPITEREEEGARRICLTFKSILRVSPQELLTKGR